ncbi:TatD family hydrolase [Patescibacteria group bacterium]|nr:TatD family hydrolase [Patescibacteria group bacterium]
MIDTHAHLTKRLNEKFELPAISRVILAGSTLEDSEENIDLASQFPGTLSAAVGVHPQEIIFDETRLEDLLQNNPGIVAVGECGLDFSHEFNFKEQERKFRAQIELAITYRKPLIIHARKAVDETVVILNEYAKIVGGVFHCYSGGRKRIPKITDLGERWFMGIDGNVTYEEGLAGVVKSIPKDRLVLETDSPLLTPLPYRGEKNKPDWVLYVYRKVAEIWQMSFEETERIIDDNAQRLFQIV